MKETITWPKVLYMTPPSWGRETHVLEEREIKEVVVFLRSLGEDWENVSPDDLEEMTFMEELEPGYALYKVAERCVVVTLLSEDALMDRYAIAGAGVG